MTSLGGKAQRVTRGLGDPAPRTPLPAGGRAAWVLRVHSQGGPRTARNQPEAIQPELDMEQQTGSKQGKEYVKAVIATVFT